MLNPEQCQNALSSFGRFVKRVWRRRKMLSSEWTKCVPKVLSDFVNDMSTRSVSETVFGLESYASHTTPRQWLRRQPYRKINKRGSQDASGWKIRTFLVGLFFNLFDIFAITFNSLHFLKWKYFLNRFDAINSKTFHSDCFFLFPTGGRDTRGRYLVSCGRTTTQWKMRIAECCMCSCTLTLHIIFNIWINLFWGVSRKNVGNLYSIRTQRAQRTPNDGSATS